MYYQPNWKDSLEKLERFTAESVGNINTTIFLLSRCSDDVGEVQAKARQFLDEHYSSVDFTGVLDTILERLRTLIISSSSQLYVEQTTAEYLRALHSFVPVASAESASVLNPPKFPSPETLFTKVLSGSEGCPTLWDHRAFVSLLQRLGQNESVLVLFLGKLAEKEIDSNLIDMSRHMILGAMQSPLGIEWHDRILRRLLDLIEFSPQALTEIQEDRLTPESAGAQWLARGWHVWAHVLNTILSILKQHLEAKTNAVTLGESTSATTEKAMLLGNEALRREILLGVLVFALTPSPERPWITHAIHNTATDVLQCLVEISGLKDTSALILSQFVAILTRYPTHALDYQKSEYQTLKSANDVNREVLLWSSLNVKSQLESEQVVALVLKMTFNLFNTAEVENKIAATRILAHLSETGTLFFGQNEADLIRRSEGKSEKSLVEKLVHSMNFRETRLLEPLVPFAFSFGMKSNDPRANCQLLVEQVIYEFQYLNESEHYLIYLNHLPALLDFIGIHLVACLKRFMAQLMRLLENFALMRQPPFLAALNVLETIVKNCWPRIGGYKEEILKTIVVPFLKMSDTERNSADGLKIKSIVRLLWQCKCQFDERAAFAGIPCLEELIATS